MNNQKISVKGLAVKLAIIIAWPIIVFGFLGRLADKNWNTSPIFFISGLFASLIITTYLIHRRMFNLKK